MEPDKLVNGPVAELWLGEEIKDVAIEDEVAAIENTAEVSAAASRAQILDIIRK